MVQMVNPGKWITTWGFPKGAAEFKDPGLARRANRKNRHCVNIALLLSEEKLRRIQGIG
jgi:hypothetical protein